MISWTIAGERTIPKAARPMVQRAIESLNWHNLDIDARRPMGRMSNRYFAVERIAYHELRMDEISHLAMTPLGGELAGVTLWGMRGSDDRGRVTAYIAEVGDYLVPVALDWTSREPTPSQEMVATMSTTPAQHAIAVLERIGQQGAPAQVPAQAPAQPPAQAPAQAPAMEPPAPPPKPDRAQEKAHEEATARQIWLAVETCLEHISAEDLHILANAIDEDPDLLASLIGETLAAKTDEPPSLERALQGSVLDRAAAWPASVDEVRRRIHNAARQQYVRLPLLAEGTPVKILVDVDRDWTPVAKIVGAFPGDGGNVYEVELASGSIATIEDCAIVDVMGMQASETPAQRAVRVLEGLD